MHEPENTHDIGDQPLIRGWFTVDKVPTDPDTVEARFRRPDGTEGGMATTKELVGQWVATFPPIDQHGYWTGRIKGTAGVIAAAEVRFYVRPTAFENP